MNTSIVRAALAVLLTTTFACEGGDLGLPEGAIEVSAHDLTAAPFARIQGPTELTSSVVPRLVGFDWVQWGYFTDLRWNRKAGVTTKLVGGDTSTNYTKIGGGGIARYSPNSSFPQIRWTDGTPTTMGQTGAGIGTGVAGTGFKVRVAATPEVKTINLYATVFNATATLQYSSPSIASVSRTVTVGSARKVYQFEIDVHSQQAENGFVTIKLDSVSASNGLVALHAVALGQYPARGMSMVSFTPRVNVPPSFPQPPLYWAGGHNIFARPLDLAGSTVDIPSYSYDPGGTREKVYGFEIWSDGVKRNEGDAFTGLNYREDRSGPHQIQVAVVGDLGTRSLSSFSEPIWLWAWTVNQSPLTIPDLTCVDQPLVVTTDSATNRTREVDVSFSLDHTYVGDLDIYLISPAGKSVRIVGRVGGGGQNFVDTRIETNAVSLNAPRIDAASAPFTQVYGPSEDLVPMFNEPIKGTWIFRVCDRASLDTGLLRWVRLYLETF